MTSESLPNFDPIDLDDPELHPSQLDWMSEVLKDYSRYCTCRAMALRSKDAGYLKVANLYLKACEDIYQRMHELAKWR